MTIRCIYKVSAEPAEITWNMDEARTEFFSCVPLLLLYESPGADACVSRPACCYVCLYVVCAFVRMGVYACVCVCVVVRVCVRAFMLVCLWKGGSIYVCVCARVFASELFLTSKSKK